MTQFNVARQHMFVAGAALSQYRRVKLSAGKLAYAGATDVELGTLDIAAFADLDVVPVVVRTAQGTAIMVASEAITAGNPCYAAANGKVAATGTVRVGLALETSTADGDYIEVLRGNDSGLGVTGVAGGYKVARGSAAALDGSNPTPIATGLSTITAACVQLRGTAAPGDNTSVLTCDYTGADGTLNVYAWKNTGGTDPTLVASTGTETFDWIAFGT